MQQNIRHPENRNVTVRESAPAPCDDQWAYRGPVIVEYEERLRQVIDRAFANNARVFALRLDLHLPAGWYARPGERCVITRFFASLRAKIHHQQQKAKRPRHVVPRFVWAREHGVGENPHYHVLLLLNGDAYNWVGNIHGGDGGDNLSSRLVEAWASALSMGREEVLTLVHVPDEAAYRIARDDSDGRAKLFNRGRYLCKVATKSWGSCAHAFDYSRS